MDNRQYWKDESLRIIEMVDISINKINNTGDLQWLDAIAFDIGMLKDIIEKEL